MPNDKPVPLSKYNPESGSSHMDILPLDPRQGQPLDMTIPHARDEILPDLRPGVQQPLITPLPLPDPNVRPVLPRLAPGQYDPHSTGVTRT